MKKIPKEKTFKSSDLSLVATIQLFGIQIQEMDRSNPERIVFVIEKSEKLNSLIQAFWSRSLKVEPLSYFEALKATKSRIYQ